jgi:A/G-specific adenine glycosylase
MNLKVFINPDLFVSRINGRLSISDVNAFKDLTFLYYREHGREFPWRKTHDPYHILVSEVMLQQTQVDRVVGKYQAFVEHFPHIETLNQAPLDEVLGLWKGLGYNRRCLSLKRIAGIIVNEHGGMIPDSVEELIKLPGVGPATAAGICCFAYNKPALYLETNIRTLFLHLFFQDRDEVSDREILPLLEQTMDRNDPRRWYFALMDYGAMLKREVGNQSRRSRHYIKQSPFEGSDRQLRGRILELLLTHRILTATKIMDFLNEDHRRIARIMDSLQREGFIQGNEHSYTISK